MASFQVAARALIHLGSELITSDPIAIYELIKNAIDAKSPNVKVLFCMPFPQDDLTELADKWVNMDPKSESWKLEIIDDLDFLVNIQRDELDENVIDRIEKYFKLVRTSESPKEASEYLLQINSIEVKDTGIGMSEEILNNVFLTVGTNFKLHSSNEEQPILGNKGIGRLSMMRLGKSATVTSWQNHNEANSIKFDWREFESETKLISEINFPITETSLHSSASESGTSIVITHLSRDWTQKNVRHLLIEQFLRRLRNPLEQKKFRFPIHVFYNSFSSDARLAIKKMSEELMNGAQKSLSLKFSPDANVPLKLVIKDENGDNSDAPYETDLTSLSHRFDCSEKDLQKIGKFQFNLRWYNRNLFRDKLKLQGLSSSHRALLKELNVWSGGIAIYRDGFRIGYSGSFDDKDWFEIDKKALRSQGYTLNRIQLVGSLEISKKHNQLLQDRSNREGLLDNKQLEIVAEMINNIALHELRELINKEKGIEATEVLNHVIDEGAGQAGDKLKIVTQEVIKLSKTAKPELKQSLSKINDELHYVANQIEQFEKATSHIKENREDILELAGTGTMVHVVMHELVRTTAQTRELIKKISKTADSKTSELLNKLENEIKVLNVRLRQFDPVSNNGRQRKSQVNLLELVNTILKGYRGKFKRHEIIANVTVDGLDQDSTFCINMVRGFITIAIENLIANSVYWLKQDAVFSHLVNSEQRTILIDIDTETRSICISDSGPGIAKSDKERIFTAGFTTKKSQRDGKGFGLFIAREVTQYHGGQLYLDNEANTDGRLRHFILELPKK
jgi:signal transduction histidine kinase